MAINTLEYAKVFMAALDAQIMESATTGWMEENAAQVRFTGGNEVKIPKLSMSGLGNYDRDNGFQQGSVSLSYETKKMSQDRGRTFQLDAMDVDETNFSTAAGNIMGEFQRTKVIPEIDAYRYSKIYKAAQDGGKTTTYTPDKATILQKLLEDISAIQDTAGDGTELVISMPIPVAAILDQAEGLERIINVGEFRQGGVSMNVRTINGIPLIRVPSLRMKTAYKFYDGVTESQEEGGFAAAEEAKQINWIITGKRAPIAVSKTDVARIFDPATNQTANAWKIDYRKYHDLWLLDHGVETIRASVGA